MATATEIEQNGVSLEEALAKTKFGKFNYALVPLCGCLMTCWYYEAMGAGYYLPMAECDLKIASKQDYGIVNGMLFAGIILSYHLWGFLADTRGRRNVLIFSMFGAFFFSVLSSFSNSFWMLAIMKFFNGFFVSASSCICFAYMGEFHSSKDRSRILMMGSTVYGAIGLMLPASAWLIINQDWSFDIPLIGLAFKPWRLFVLYLGLPSLIGAIALMFCPETPKFVYSAGNEEKALKILREMYSINTGLDDYPVQKITDPEFGTASSKTSTDYLSQIWRQTRTLFQKDYLRTTLVMCMLQIGACSSGVGMLLYFPKVLNTIASFTATVSSEYNYTVCDIMDYSKALEANATLSLSVTSEAINQCLDKLDITSYTYSTLMEVLYMLGFFTVGMLVNFIGVIPWTVAIFLANAIASIALIFCKIPTLSAYLYVILLLYGINWNIVGTATIEFYPTNLRSSAVSVSLICGRLGSLAGSYVIGLLYEYHCNSTFILCAVTFLLSCCVAFFLPKIEKDPESNKKSKEIA